MLMLIIIIPIRYFETWMKYIVDESRGKQPDKNAGSEDRIIFIELGILREQMDTHLMV
jgi:hypothetical protein